MSFYALSVAFRCSQLSSPIITQDRNHCLLWLVAGATAGICRDVLNFFLIGIVGGGIQSPLGTAATNCLLCQPWVIMMMEKLVE
jgi:hypothetical protein